MSLFNEQSFCPAAKSLEISCLAATQELSNKHFCKTKKEPYVFEHVSFKAESQKKTIRFDGEIVPIYWLLYPESNTNKKIKARKANGDGMRINNRRTLLLKNAMLPKAKPCFLIFAQTSQTKELCLYLR